MLIDAVDHIFIGKHVPENAKHVINITNDDTYEAIWKLLMTMVLKFI